MGNCDPSKTNVNLGFASVDIGFRGVTISHVTLTCSQFLYKYHLSSSYITRCQVPSPVRSWFLYSAGDIDFYQMSLSQSEWSIIKESKILHKSILINIILLCKIVDSDWIEINITLSCKIVDFD